MAVGMDQRVAGLAPRLFTLEEETGSQLTNCAKTAESEMQKRSELPIRLLPPCTRTRTDGCMPVHTRSGAWRRPGALVLPSVPESAQCP